MLEEQDRDKLNRQLICLMLAVHILVINQMKMTRKVKNPMLGSWEAIKRASLSFRRSSEDQDGSEDDHCHQEKVNWWWASKSYEKCRSLDDIFVKYEGIAQGKGITRIDFLVLPVSRNLVGDQVIVSIALLSRGVAKSVARLLCRVLKPCA